MQIDIKYVPVKNLTKEIKEKNKIADLVYKTFIRIKYNNR